MSKRGKLLRNWSIIFFSLMVLTAFSLARIIPTSNQKAYAATINSNPNLQNSAHLVLVSQSEDQGGNFISRLTKTYEQKKICSLNDEQYQLLQSEIQTGSETVNINGNDVNFITVSDKDTNPGQLMKIIPTYNDHDSGSCSLVKNNQTNLFFILFRTDVS